LPCSTSSRRAFGDSEDSKGFTTAEIKSRHRAKCSAREEKLFHSSPGNFGLPCAFLTTNKVVDELELTVKVLPFVFALVPLVAVVSACVSTY
jgi:hypothetical protein